MPTLPFLQDFQHMWLQKDGGWTDRRTTCNRNNTLCTIEHHAVKMYGPNHIKISKNERTNIQITAAKNQHSVQRDVNWPGLVRTVTQFVPWSNGWIIMLTKLNWLYNMWQSPTVAYTGTIENGFVIKIVQLTGIISHFIVYFCSFYLCMYVCM